MRTRASVSRHVRAFTLMELLVVITILGLLVSIVAKNLFPLVYDSRQKTCRMSIVTLTGAVENYRRIHGKLPESLDVLCQPDPKYAGEAHLTDATIPDDPWDHPFVYEKTSGSKFTISSLGADGAPGGEGEDADIRSTDPKP